MVYALYECNEANTNKMNKIWEGVWTGAAIDRQISDIEEDDMLPIFRKYLPKDKPILEGGCGLGRWIIYFKNKGYDILGIDFAKTSIGKLKEYDSSLPVEYGDVTKTRFADNTFYAYISIGVVEHFRKGPLATLREAKRILAREGLLLISIPVFNKARRFIVYFENLLKFFNESTIVRKILGKDGYPTKHFFEFRYTEKEFEDILEETGFKIIEKYPLEHRVDSLFNYYREVPSPLLKGRFLYKICDKIARCLKRKSEWIAPHTVMWVCGIGS